MSTEAKQILGKAGLHSSEFLALVLAMVVTLGGAQLGVSAPVLMTMWGVVGGYIGARTVDKGAKTKAVVAIEGKGNGAKFG